MHAFLKESIEDSKFELLIDTKIFPKDIILKASYSFLDVGYFFFKYNDERDMILQFSLREGITKDPREVLINFGNELLDMYLRDRLEKENRVIRETIVSKSLLGPLDSSNFVSHDPENPVHIEKGENETIDFDKDIDEIIKEIENDPDLQIDEEEIQQMLREIEEESSSKQDIPNITIDPDAVSQIKQQFKKQDT